MRTRLVTATVLVAAMAALSACSSTSEPASPSGAVAPSAAGSEPAQSPAPPGTAEMKALRTQMVDSAMSPQDATALAEQNGYVARVGTVDGAPQALTMDYREDRFTFDVEGGVVTGCTYG